MNTVPDRAAKISGLNRFLWFCSGANPDILADCPKSEQIKFAGVGGTVFFTGMLATLSGGYAFYTVFEHWVAALFFGLLWGLIIFNLDRFIVSTIKKEGSTAHQLLLALPRILLAIVLAIVIAKPLELRIFQGEINELLTDRVTEKIDRADAEELAAISEQEAAILQLSAATKESYLNREAHYQDYKCECDGTCGTGVRGRGSECERKEAKYLQSNSEYLELKALNERETSRLRTEIIGIQARALEARELAEMSFSRGLMARISASSALPGSASIMLSLLILLIEISPVLAKILAPRGPYDDALKKTEQQYYLQQLQELKEQQLSLNQKSELKAQLDEVEMEQMVNQRKEALKAISAAKIELVQDQVDEWLDAERKRLRDEKKNKG